MTNHNTAPTQHFITVKEDGKRKSVLYAGNGNTTRLRIHAIRYSQPLDKLTAWCEELTRDNPGITFTPKPVDGSKPRTVATHTSEDAPDICPDHGAHNEEYCPGCIAARITRCSDCNRDMSKGEPHTAECQTALDQDEADGTT